MLPLLRTCSRAGRWRGHLANFVVDVRVSAPRRLRPRSNTWQGASALALGSGAAAAGALQHPWPTGCEAADAPPAAAPLEGRRDAYGGLILDPAGLPSGAADFERRLDCSLSTWRGEGVRGVWLQIPLEKAHLISIAVDRGFIFHHAERHYCMLTHWLPVDVPSPLPPNASSQVGVGALVVNEDGKVLLVQEAVGPLRGKDVWKIPTGLLNQGEDIRDGAVRECLEETGVEADFEKVLAFRHAHKAAFGKGDLFFVCLLRARGWAAEAFRLQEAEIARAKWGDFGEFLQQAPYPRDTPVWAELYSRCLGEDGVIGNVPGFRAEQLMQTQKPGAPHNFIYY